LSDGRTVTYDGLVPCGRTVKINGSEEVIHCQLCHFFVMLDAILDFVLVNIVIPVAILMIVIAGIMFYLSSGNPANLRTANAIITATITGLFLIFGAWVLVNTFFTVIGVANWEGFGEGWFEIECEIKAPETFIPKNLFSCFSDL